MRLTRIGRSIAAVASLALAGSIGVAFIPNALAEDATTEAFPANVCTDFVTPTHVIEGDRTADGKDITPQPAADGSATPVILVHGWTAHGKHINHNPHQGSSQYSLYVDRVADGSKGYTLPKEQVSSSFIGMLQQIPGAAVYMFDYEAVNTHWVTDPQIGKKLANGIECLTKHYGKKAVVVGHSMGGLAARAAMAERDSQGKDVSARVAHLVTFGTPNEGTALFQLAYDLVDASLWVPGVNIATGLTKVILKKCSEMADKTGQFCFGMGGPPDAMYTEGARAMLPDSAALQALPKVPDSVPYTALAGDIQLGGYSMFGFNSKRLIDMGDFAVPLDSAIAGADEHQVSTCEYGIAAIASGKHRIGIKDWVQGHRTTHILTPLDLSREMATPCYHNNLMSEVNLVTKAIATIKSVVDHPVALDGAASEIAPDEEVTPTEGTETTPSEPAPSTKPAEEGETTSDTTEEGPAAHTEGSVSVVPGEVTHDKDAA
ncbi:MAG: hypothetical protein Q4B10_02410 [Actinomycetaceae bacterium]|nr:hypothetical protein [Actinomycetaceae bacterium]